jgi:hypothetical protein
VSWFERELAAPGCGRTRAGREHGRGGGGAHGKIAGSALAPALRTPRIEGAGAGEGVRKAEEGGATGPGQANQPHGLSAGPAAGARRAGRGERRRAGGWRRTVGVAGSRGSAGGGGGVAALILGNCRFPKKLSL